jgi:adenylate cyclase
VRDVAYESLLRRKRPAAHRRVAEGLRAIHPGADDEFAELLAFHHEAAGDTDLAVAAL